MSDIKLDLTKTRIFGQDELIIDKKLTFIFGKNGTGKSTLTSLFKSQMKESQMKDFDVSCFQGFDDILGEDEKLNAVVLGEENNEINNQIKSLEDQISEKVKEIKKLEKETQKSEEKPNNLWQEVENSKNSYQEQTNKINNFCTKAASKIKNITNPQVASTNYNINNFKDEIDKAKSLTNEEIKSRETLIKTDVKTATRISYKEIELNHLLDFTNTLLLKKVEEQVIIPEFLGNPLKRDFAEQGLKIHAINNNCAFCGNAVSKERYEKLKRYFSADDVDKFKKEINSHINILNNTINNIKEVHLSTSDFYPEYLVEVNQVIVSFNSKKEEVLKFLNTLKEATDNKSKYLFEECKTVGITIPHQFKEEVDKYNGLVDKNNISDLKTKQKQARDELRYNEIKKYIDSFKYNEEVSERDKLEGEYSAKNSELEKKEIDNIKKEIQGLETNISSLQSGTKNEKILADKINGKLKLYVNFTLEHINEDNQGHYKVRCKNTKEIRKITELSLGEKNIIAFLYFILKLDEVNNKNLNNKIIIFDDPMTSNDDTMQYLIIEELNNLVKRLKDQDKLLIMTHNNHFYLNVKYPYDSYKKHTFYRLVSNGVKIEIKKLTDKKEDFKTNYEALWKELEFLYDSAPCETMLLNPIRRIIETFTKFNSIPAENKNKMLGSVEGAVKLFNVNSHSIEDLEADLGGIDKVKIINIMKECFIKMNAVEHFNNYWTKESTV